MAISRKGLRCDVCTGCGLCPGIIREEQRFQKLDIVSECLLPEFGRHPEGADDAGLFGVQLFPAAIDIGTTTIAMVLYDCAGKALGRYAAANPQRKYGADVLSRIKACRKPEQAEDMRLMIRRELGKGMDSFRKLMPEGGRILPFAAANTTETYLCMGWDPEELGQAPFTVSHKDAAAFALGDGECTLFPGLSAFVGGDITAGLYALDLTGDDRLTLFIDLGTNGEMVLGNREKVLACAAAAGPAFEGGANSGVWGSDMTALLAELRRNNILNEDGVLAEPYFDNGIRVGNVRITQESIRAIQMAKGAVAAGVDILLEEYGVSADEVERVVLAGGFGYYLNPEDAAEIGLLQEALCARAVSGGNTSLAGCMKAGFAAAVTGDERAAVTAAEEIRSRVTCLNLANMSAFNEKYIAHLALKRC